MEGCWSFKVIVGGLLFSRIFIRSLNAQRESRENWIPAQNGRPDWVAGKGWEPR